MISRSKDFFTIFSEKYPKVLRRTAIITLKKLRKAISAGRACVFSILPTF